MGEMGSRRVAQRMASVVDLSQCWSLCRSEDTKLPDGSVNVAKDSAVDGSNPQTLNTETRSLKPKPCGSSPALCESESRKP